MARSLKKYVSDARAVWNHLNGLIVVYKSAGQTSKKTREALLHLMCQDLNAMHVRPPTTHISIVGETTSEMKVLVRPSFADHTLVVGPRYQPQDCRLLVANTLGSDTSGVLVVGVNSGTSHAYKLRHSAPTRFYKVKGLLGQATDNYFSTGKIAERSTYKHVRRDIIDRICSSMQAAHQRKMFELCGVDIQSQAAYELALKGQIRPVDKNIPMVYTIKCVDFTPPEFTIEVVCVNEYEMYLKAMIHEIGMQLHSTATCTQVQCYKFGLFDIGQALLSKHWNIQCIVNNMEECRKIIKANPFLLKQDSPVLIEPNT